jgi:hypothetical protein
LTKYLKACPSYKEFPIELVVTSLKSLRPPLKKQSVIGAVISQSTPIRKSLCLEGHHATRSTFETTALAPKPVPSMAGSSSSKPTDFMMKLTTYTEQLHSLASSVVVLHNKLEDVVNQLKQVQDDQMTLYHVLTHS